jgi:hypothetical protein
VSALAYGYRDLEFFKKGVKSAEWSGTRFRHCRGTPCGCPVAEWRKLCRGPIHRAPRGSASGLSALCRGTPCGCPVAEWRKLCRGPIHRAPRGSASGLSALCRGTPCGCPSLLACDKGLRKTGCIAFRRGGPVCPPSLNAATPGRGRIQLPARSCRRGCATAAPRCARRCRPERIAGGTRCRRTCSRERWSVTPAGAEAARSRRGRECRCRGRAERTGSACRSSLGSRMPQVLPGAAVDQLHPEVLAACG